MSLYLLIRLCPVASVALRCVYLASIFCSTSFFSTSLPLSFFSTCLSSPCCFLVVLLLASRLFAFHATTFPIVPSFVSSSPFSVFHSCLLCLSLFFSSILSRYFALFLFLIDLLTALPFNFVVLSLLFHLL